MARFAQNDGRDPVTVPRPMSTRCSSSLRNEVVYGNAPIVTGLHEHVTSAHRLRSPLKDVENAVALSTAVPEDQSSIGFCLLENESNGRVANSVAQVLRFRLQPAAWARSNSAWLKFVPMRLS
jgi:hypothetical protein